MLVFSACQPHRQGNQILRETRGCPMNDQVRVSYATADM